MTAGDWQFVAIFALVALAATLLGLGLCERARRWWIAQYNTAITRRALIEEEKEGALTDARYWRERAYELQKQLNDEELEEAEDYVRRSLGVPEEGTG